MDRECADARYLSSWERFRAAGFAVVACARASPEGTALSGRRRRDVSEADTPVASVRFGGGLGSARRGPSRRGAATVDFVAAVRLRGSRTAAASDLRVDLVAVGLGLAVAVRLPAVPPRRGLTGVVGPLALSRELTHNDYPRVQSSKPERIQRRSATHKRHPTRRWREGQGRLQKYVPSHRGKAGDGPRQ
ncbi:MAG: hypothetical protein JWR37_2563 [Mycobacterium sp.]|nr:hypothetical protein [Mycobacterium sp.]